MKVKRYTGIQRVFHIVNLASVLILLVSGLGIYSPALLSFVGLNTKGWFDLHLWFIPIFITAVTFHIIWDNFILNRFNNMWIGPDERKRGNLILKNFFGLTKAYPRYTKYHPAQILYHWGAASCLILIALSGFVMWQPVRSLVPFQIFGQGWDFILFMRVVHDFFTFALLALVMGHVYFGLFIKKNWVESLSMVSGSIPLEHYEEVHELTPDLEYEPEGQPEHIAAVPNT